MDFLPAGNCAHIADARYHVDCFNLPGTSMRIPDHLYARGKEAAKHEFDNRILSAAKKRHRLHSAPSRKTPHSGVLSAFIGGQYGSFLSRRLPFSVTQITWPSMKADEHRFLLTHGRDS